MIASVLINGTTTLATATDVQCQFVACAELTASACGSVTSCTWSTRDEECIFIACELLDPSTQCSTFYNGSAAGASMTQYCATASGEQCHFVACSLLSSTSCVLAEGRTYGGSRSGAPSYRGPLDGLSSSTLVPVVVTCGIDFALGATDDPELVRAARTRYYGVSVGSHDQASKTVTKVKKRRRWLCSLFARTPSMSTNDASFAGKRIPSRGFSRLSSVVTLQLFMLTTPLPLCGTVISM